MGRKWGGERSVDYLAKMAWRRDRLLVGKAGPLRSTTIADLRDSYAVAGWGSGECVDTAGLPTVEYLVATWPSRDQIVRERHAEKEKRDAAYAEFLIKRRDAYYERTGRGRNPTPSDLTEAEVRLIRRSSPRMSYKQIARLTGLTTSSVANICRFKARREVQGEW